MSRPPAKASSRLAAAARACRSAMCACFGIQSGPGKLPASPATIARTGAMARRKQGWRQAPCGELKSYCEIKLKRKLMKLTLMDYTRSLSELTLTRHQKLTAAMCAV